LFLSSLSLSNDSMEGKVIAKAFVDLARKKSLSNDVMGYVQRALSIMERSVDGLGFCLSENGDLLSQWRGYAADATGVAIGFSFDYLRLLSTRSERDSPPGFTVKKVEYESSGHERCVEPTLRRLELLIDKGEFKRPAAKAIKDEPNCPDFRARIMTLAAVQGLFGDLFRLKHHAFREECEWRLLSYFRGGTDSNEDCLYRAGASRIIPYRKFTLVELEHSPISEIVLGTKHGTPPDVVEGFLRRSGYGGVEVRRSEASYR
jgi:hypothetical protein